MSSNDARRIAAILAFRVASCNPRCDAAFHEATRTVGDPVAGLRRDRRRRLHGRPRPVDRERGVPVDAPVLPRGLDGHAVVGPRRLQRRVRRAAPRGGPDRRPFRAPAHLPARLADLHRRVAAVRHRAVGVAADRRTGRPGHRCRPADAGVTRPAAVRHRARGEGPGGGDVGWRVRARRRHRAVARLGPHRRRRVALGILRQPASRARRRRRRSAGGARIGHRRASSRPRRRRAALGRGGGPRPGDHPGR